MLVTYRIVRNLRSLDIQKEYKYYFWTITLFCVTVAVLTGVFIGDNSVDFFYLAVKTISILINISLFVRIMYKIYHLMKIAPGSNATSRSRAERSLSHADAVSNPVYVLAMRLQYYCIVQTVTRVGASWYQLQYGFDTDSYHEGHASTMQNVR